MIDPELHRKAESLLKSEHFVNHVEQGALAEKQSIFLVLCGKKPVSEATSGKWVVTAEGAHSEPEDEAKLGDFLSSLGLTYHLTSDQYATDAVVSLDKDMVSQYLQGMDDMRSAGRLFGYPITAIEAFVAESVLDSDEQDRLMEAAGLPIYMPRFRLSREHAAEELEVLKDWYVILRMYNLTED